MKNKNYSLGFTFIELIIAIGLVGIFIPAIYRVLSFSLMESRQGEQYAKAWGIAREGMESIYAVKSSWSWSAGSPADNTVTTTNIPPFTRTVTINDVARCGIEPNKVICPGGTNDVTTRKITVDVIWLEQGQNQTVSLHSYVTKH